MDELEDVTILWIPSIVIEIEVSSSMALDAFNPYRPENVEKSAQC